MRPRPGARQRFGARRGVHHAESGKVLEQTGANHLWVPRGREGSGERQGKGTRRYRYTASMGVCVRGESLQVLGVLLATRLVLGVLLARHERRELRGNTEVCTSGLAPSNGGGGDGVGWRMGWTWASGMHVMIMQRTGVQSRFGVYSRELGWLLAQGRFVQRLSSFAAQTAACSSSACWLVILIGAGSSEVGARSPGAEVGISFVCIS